MCCFDGSIPFGGNLTCLTGIRPTTLRSREKAKPVNAASHRGPQGFADEVA
eukprot:CAMPEP_0113235760 /NCGR_PEP_ID=MMETSP0008_2-20120614/3729_1 /TAXON_ID=97485 /ORGANISM="Prymnesium parvum" /LENGTH=50 /DNA_ID=CAMNT_0000082711 /DNA_START=936 /DNA_END=1088 /DNA_ORIENTATION=- /assembly_acc=CAM_ASM_000153